MYTYIHCNCMIRNLIIYLVYKIIFRQLSLDEKGISNDFTKS